MFRNFFLNLSLNKKLIFMMIFLSFVLLSILFFLSWQSEKALFNELASETAELSKAIQIGVEEVTSSGSTDESRLAQYLSTLKSKGINEISIISNTDEVVVSTNPTKVGPVSPKKKEMIIKAELGEPVSKEGKTYNVILPVIAGDAHYGYIHLKFNTEDVSQILQHNMMKRVGAAIFVFAIGIGISVFLSFRYTEPIHSVVRVIKKVAAGDLNETLPADRKDEIGELNEGVNFMVKKLREDRQLEERLREAEHLSAVGQLSRSIAHEIRNPLNFISLSIDHIKGKYQPHEEVDARNFDALMSSIKHEIHRLNKLVSDFLEYGRPLKLTVQRVSMGGLINDVVALVRAKAETERVTIKENYAFLPELIIDPELIKACLVNVIMNSLQAMTEGGVLTLNTEKSNGNFMLSVSDTGVGVSKENIQKVFEPFFTTKDTGLGLGLATTKRVIEEHRGRIDFYSNEGKGSETIISLKLIET